MKVRTRNSGPVGFTLTRGDEYGMSIRWGEGNYIGTAGDLVEVAFITPEQTIAKARDILNEDEWRDDVWGYMEGAVAFSILTHLFAQGSPVKYCMQALDLGCEVVPLTESKPG